MVRGNRMTVEEGRTPRRLPTEIPQLNANQIAEICERANSTRDECLIALLYLSGRRINEILPLRKRDFSFSKLNDEHELSFVTRNEKSWRKEPKSGFPIKVERFNSKGEWKAYYYEEIRPTFSLISPAGRALGNYVLEHLYTLQDDEYLFAPESHSANDHIGQPMAYTILRKLDNRLWLHALRHLSFTRLATLYRDDPTEMHNITFHRRFESTLLYIEKKKTQEKRRQF